MSAHDFDALMLAARSTSRGSRLLFAVMAGAFLVRSFWSLENLWTAGLIQNLCASIALVLFAANFHLAPRRSLPYALIWLAVVATAVATGADILLGLGR